MKKILLLLFFFGFTLNLSLAQNKDFEKIKALMKIQSDCWNNGDIDCFMETYWKSEKLQFIGSKGPTYGWQQTLDNYKKSYPNKEAMGKLTFDIINMDRRSRKVITVVGKWHLGRTGDFGDLEGHFLLVLKKIKRKWVIVADHSS